MSFVCGALIWANVAPSMDSIPKGKGFPEWYEPRAYGWPLICYEEEFDLRPSKPWQRLPATTTNNWNYSALLIDIPINLGILCLATFLFEYWMRKRRRIVPIPK